MDAFVSTGDRREATGHLLPSGREIIWEAGYLLEPHRLSQRTLDDLKLSIGSLAFSGQLQQATAGAG